MLNETTVGTEIYKFSVNYSIEMKKNEENEYDYVKFLFNDLKEEGFDDNDFITAIRTIKRENPNMYGKMPNLAMFIEARPKGQYVSNRPENQVFIANEQPKQIEKKLTPEQQKELDERIAKNMAKLKARVYTSKKEQDAQKKYWDEFLKQNPPKDNPIKQGVLSPQLQKLKEQNK